VRFGLQMAQRGKRIGVDVVRLEHLMDGKIARIWECRDTERFDGGVGQSRAGTPTSAAPLASSTGLQ